jgi:hypothetical protein
MRLIVAILLSAITSFGATRVSKVASEFSLSSPFVYTIDSDTAEGSWKVPFTTVGDQSATIALGQTLPAGTYVVFVQWLDYDMGHKWTYTIGGVTSALQSFNDRDVDTLYWTTGLQVTALSSFSSITFNFVKQAVRDARFMAFCISDDLKDFVFSDSRLVNFNYPTSVNPEAAVIANKIPNSSFECGVNNFWQIIPIAGHQSTNRVDDMPSTIHAHTGLYSYKMRVPASGQMSYQSIPFSVGSNKVCSASVWVRSPTVNVTANLYIQSIYTQPVTVSEAPLLVNTSSTITPADGWKQISFTFTNLYFPNDQVFCTMLSQSFGTATDIYWDDVYVSQGTATTWRPMHPFEFDIDVSKVTHVFFTNEVGTLNINGYNNSASLLTKNINYHIVNHLNQTISTNTVPLTVNAGTRNSTTVSLDLTRRGHFRIFAGIEGQNSDTEITYVVKAPNLIAGVDTNSYFGSHMTDSYSDYEVNKDLGVKWRRRVSLGRARWSEVEDKSGVFNWPVLVDPVAYGIVDMGNLGETAPMTNSSSHAGYIVGATNINNTFGRWITNYVTRYPWLKAIEIWNEPEQAIEGFSLAYYGTMVNLAIPLLQTWAPNMQIVSGGGVLDVDDVFAFWPTVGTYTNSAQAISVHLYPGNETVSSNVNTEVGIAFGKPIWMTESGYSDDGSFTFNRANIRTAGYHLASWRSGDIYYDGSYSSIEAVSRNVIVCLANGQTKYFYYDGGQRRIGTVDYSSRQFTYIERDDTVKAKGAVVANLFGFLDKTTGHGSIATNSLLIAYAFTSGTNPIVAFWSATNLINVTLSGLVTTNFKRYDVMGNEESVSSLTLTGGRLPTLIVGHGALTLSTLTNAFRTSTVAVRTDTTAPYLQLVNFPKSTQDSWRWFAIDDLMAPTESNPNAVLYSYSTDNGQSFTDFNGLTQAPYSTGIIVRAKDQAGNISTLIYNATLINPEDHDTAHGNVLAAGNLRIE